MVMFWGRPGHVVVDILKSDKAECEDFCLSQDFEVKQKTALRSRHVYVSIQACKWQKTGHQGLVPGAFCKKLGTYEPTFPTRKLQLCSQSPTAVPPRPEKDVSKASSQVNTSTDRHGRNTFLPICSVRPLLCLFSTGIQRSDTRPGTKPPPAPSPSCNCHPLPRPPPLHTKRATCRSRSPRRGNARSAHLSPPRPATSRQLPAAVKRRRRRRRCWKSNAGPTAAGLGFHYAVTL